MEKTSHVALLLSSFRAGGGEKQLIEIANAFVERGHAVDLLVLRSVGEYKSHIHPQVRIVSLDAFRMIFSLPKIILYLRRERPVVMLTLDEYTHILALLARFIAHVETRVVLRIGNMLSVLATQYEGRAKRIAFFTKHLFKKADAIIAHGVADDVIAVTGIDAKKVHVIYNPKSCVDILRQAEEPVANKWLSEKSVPVVIAVGRLRVQKNFPLIIRVFSEVAKTIPARLIIVGAGREEGRLRELIDELGCGDTVFLAGYSDNPYAWMKKADVYVAASLWEGLPNALLEAMACGLPAIAADCSSGPREILAPATDYRTRLSVGSGVEYAEYGALVAVNDEKALVEALGQLLLDGALRKKYAAASTARSKDFDSRDIVNEYAQVLGI